MLDDCAPDEEVLSALPIFPLPNAVLLPGVVLPLNVFERRYLELVDHALAGTKYVGVPLLKPGYERDYDGRPDIEPVFGLGRLLSHQRLPDGRRFIRLEGVRRVKLLHELEPRASFREVQVELLPEAHPRDEIQLDILKAQIERIGATMCPDDEVLLQSLLQIPDARVLVYAIAALLPTLGLMADAPIDGRSTVLELQQRCLAMNAPDARVRSLVRCAVAICDVLSDTGRFPAAMMN